VAYTSVDKLQNMLAAEVFGYTQDKKKASGRALGTLVEIATFYTLCAWGLRDHIAIERQVPEFAHPEITHNVEFSLHPIASSRAISLRPLRLPVTPQKVFQAAGSVPSGTKTTKKTLVTTRRVMRNSAIVAERDRGFTTAHLTKMNADGCELILLDLAKEPFAIFECKRVGVEEGMTKGPQTIEKAKQGAYVARSVSSLQKFRLADGQVQGVIDVGDGELRTGAYSPLLREIIDGTKPELLRDFILTVGVVSNHGNWFTAEDHNKELRVLAHSYDWLLFLTDFGLCQFIEKLLLKPVPELQPARDAFLASYPRKSGGSQFTKVTMGVDADSALKRYFQMHEPEVESWFNVIAPKGGALPQLREDLAMLAGKDWKEIRKP
jgi:hypothetical protein